MRTENLGGARRAAFRGAFSKTAPRPLSRETSALHRAPLLHSLPVLRSDTLAGIFSGQVTPANSGCFAYARNFNPTTMALGRQLAAMEGTEAAYATASGMSAIVAALLALCGTGDTVIASAAIYGGTYALLADFFPLKCGISTVWVDATDAAAVAAAFRAHPAAKALYCETLSNPTLAVPDLPALAAIAHAAGAAFVVDNTFAPLAVTPARWGADVVIHSLTKGISGASDVLAGAVCGSAAFIASLMVSGSGERREREREREREGMREQGEGRERGRGGKGEGERREDAHTQAAWPLSLSFTPLFLSPAHCRLHLPLSPFPFRT